VEIEDFGLPQNASAYRLQTRVTKTGQKDNTFPAGYTIQQLQNNGVNVPIYDTDIFQQQLTMDAFVYTSFLGGTQYVDIAPADPRFQLYLINLKGSSQLASTNTYVINVEPVTASLAYHGSVDGNGVAPVLTQAAPGEWRLEFSNKAPINGQIHFVGAAISKVTIAYPSPLATATTAELLPLSGIIPTFATDVSGPFPEIELELPSAFPTGQLVTYYVDGAVQPAVTTCAPATANLASRANFAYLPTVPPVGVAALAAGTHNVTLDYATPPVNGAAIFLVSINLADGDTITLSQNPPTTELPVIVSGLTNGVLNGRTFTKTGDGEVNGILVTGGQPSTVTLTINNSVATRRRAHLNGLIHADVNEDEDIDHGMSVYPGRRR